MAQSCCNIPGHTWSSSRKNLRPVTAWMCKRAPHISIDSKICDTCRKKLSKETQDVTEPILSEPDPPSPPSSHATESDPLFSDASEAASSLNMYLAEISETPYSQSRACSKSYARQKVKKITEALQHTVITGAPIDDGTEMIQQLKEKFQETKKRSEQVQMLTVLLKSWSVKKIQHEFGVLEYSVRQSKKLVGESGIISLPRPLRDLHCHIRTSEHRTFYESDDISGVMPGKNEFISVKKDSKHRHVQKRLVLNNLREVYCKFKERFPDCKVGFSNFAELKPIHCVLAGLSGKHSVCVCTIHQNVKLISFEMQIPEL